MKNGAATMTFTEFQIIVAGLVCGGVMAVLTQFVHV
jgi:hypothetical protein